LLIAFSLIYREVGYLRVQVGSSSFGVLLTFLVSFRVSAQGRLLLFLRSKERLSIVSHASLLLGALFLCQLGISPVENEQENPHDQVVVAEIVVHPEVENQLDHASKAADALGDEDEEVLDQG
jgi:hypothetical protein